MKKLLISAFAVVATLVAVDMNAGSCNKGCRKQTSCVKRCEAPAPKVCETVYEEEEMPNIECVRYEPVQSCCQLKKIVSTRYEAACPPGFNQRGEAKVHKPASHRTIKSDEKATTTKAGKSAKYAVQDIAE